MTDCPYRLELQSQIEEVKGILSDHTQEEMDIQKQMLETLQDHSNKFQNGIITFQKLSVADDKAALRMDSIDKKITDLDTKVEHNTEKLVQHGEAIDRLVAAVESMGESLKPIIEFINKLTAAGPFFELLGRMVTWTTKRIGWVAGVAATVWAWMQEPWKWMP